LGLNLRLLTLCAWLTLLPTKGFLPQISQTLDMIFSPFIYHRPDAMGLASDLMLFRNGVTSRCSKNTLRLE
jgi:hypothetical protein